MSDDLVKRLNELAYVEGEPTASILKEAASCIEKLEAALDDMAQYVSRADWHYLKPETLAAMEGKK